MVSVVGSKTFDGVTSKFLEKVALRALEALPDGKPSPWHWQDWVTLGNWIDLKPAEFYETYLAKRVAKALESEGLMSSARLSLKLPPGAKGAAASRDDWIVRLILDYDMASDQQRMKVDLARV